MGYNPYRRRSRRPGAAVADSLMVTAAGLVVALLLLWAVVG